jgi:hypothetical protein
VIAVRLVVVLALALFAAACASLLELTPNQFTARFSALEMSAHADRLIVVAVDNPRESFVLQAGSTPSGYGVVSSYAAHGSARAVVAAIEKEYGLREVAAWPVRPLQLHCVVLEVSEQSSLPQVVTALARDPRVRLSQPLQQFTTLASGYNDPYVGLQRGFIGVDAESAQRVTRGKGVRLAIIDTGVDVMHPDLDRQEFATRNFVDDNTDQFNRDVHGTEVAGIVGAVPNNRQGIVGIAPDVRIVVLKACWQLEGSRSSNQAAQCNSYTLAKAIAAAIEWRAQVINLSLGGPADPLLTRLIEHCLKQGTIVVGAVPDGGQLNGFPVGIPGVIAVDTSEHGSAKRDVLYAPGRDVLTLTPAAHYDFASGSSLATAHVSAIIALMLAVDSRLDAAQVYRLLDSTSVENTAIGRTINACAALAGLGQQVFCTAPL